MIISLANDSPSGADSNATLLRVRCECEGLAKIGPLKVLLQQEFPVRIDMQN